MSKIQIHNASSMEVTLVSNYFIDHFMPEANGEFVKIYLYLLRIISQAPASFSLSSVADKFCCTERDIVRALKYWEKEELCSLTFDSEENLTQLTFLPTESTSPAQKEARCASQESAAAAVRDSHPSLTQKNSLQTPDAERTLSADRVRELTEDEEIVQILYIAEQYLGRTLSPSDINKLLYFYDVLHFSGDLIDYLVEYCVSKGSRSMRYIETVALAWANEKITTVAQAKSETTMHNKNYFIILKALGLKTNPVDSQIAYMNSWLKELGFSLDLICEACRRTVLQTGQPSFQYADKILHDWHKKAVHCLSDIQKLDEAHQKKKAVRALKQQSTAAVPEKPKNNGFNNFHQRDYDFADLEKRMLNK